METWGRGTPGSGPLLMLGVRSAADVGTGDLKGEGGKQGKDMARFPFYDTPSGETQGQKGGGATAVFQVGGRRQW